MINFVVMKFYNFSSIEDYFSKYVELFSVLQVPDSKRLTQREREFFVSCMVSEYKGYSITSEIGIKFIEEHSRCKNKDIYTYRKRLIEKGWLKEKNSEYILPDIFDCNKDKTLSKKLNFNFVLSYG